MKCPVCGKYHFKNGIDGEYKFCRVCGWCNDKVQNKDPDFTGGANHMSLNQAREAYKKGEPIK